MSLLRRLRGRRPTDGAAATSDAARADAGPDADAVPPAATSPDAPPVWTGGPRPTEPTASAAPPASPTHVTDWRHIENGAIVRALGPLADDPGVGALLDFCAEKGGRSLRDWNIEAAARLADARQAGEALRRIAVREQLAAGSEFFTVNVVKALPFLGPEAAVPLLVRVADQHGRARLPRHHELVSRAAIRALGRVGGEQVLSPLRRIKSHSPLASLRKAAGSELDKVLRSAGLSQDDVPEWRAETFELNADGERRVPLRSGYAANIRLRSDGKVEAVYLAPNGRRLTGSLSAQEIPVDLARVTELVHEIRAVVRAEKARLTGLLRGDRTLDAAVWLDHYLDHPLTGRLARTLIWEVSRDSGENWTAGVPVPAGPDQVWRLRTADGGFRNIPGAGSVRLMRPLRATSREGKAWSARLRRWEITQAVSQFE